MKTNENFQLSTFNFQPDKRLAVVILNWNGRALMEEFLPSVVACTPGEWADVIVADNGSTDDSIEMLKTKFPTVGIIRLDKNYGFAEGYNQALKHIGHEYTVLLNSDVEVTPGWLDAPIAALDADKTIAGVQPNGIKNTSSMPERQGDIWTGTAIRIAADASCMSSRKMPDNMTRLPTCFGPREPACSSVRPLTKRWAASMPGSLPTRKKSICAGGYVRAATGWSVRHRRSCTTWEAPR